MEKEVKITVEMFKFSKLADGNNWDGWNVLGDGWGKVGWELQIWGRGRTNSPAIDQHRSWSVCISGLGDVFNLRGKHTFLLLPVPVVNGLHELIYRIKEYFQMVLLMFRIRGRVTERANKCKQIWLCLPNSAWISELQIVLQFLVIFGMLLLQCVSVHSVKAGFHSRNAVMILSCS